MFELCNHILDGHKLKLLNKEIEVIWFDGNADMYGGEYFADRMHGFGVYHFSNGHRYKGSCMKEEGKDLVCIL